MVSLYRIISTVSGEMKDFLFSEALVCLLVPCILDLSWRALGIRHQGLPCDFLCVWHGTFSAFALFFFFLKKKKSLVLQNSFDWSLVLQLKMKIKGICYGLLFPTCSVASGSCHKKASRDK